MSKNEFIGLVNVRLIDALRQRDRVDVAMYPEEYGYYNGQFKAYETVVSMLVSVDVSSLRADDSRNFVAE